MSLETNAQIIEVVEVPNELEPEAMVSEVHHHHHFPENDLEVSETSEPILEVSEPVEVVSDVPETVEFEITVEELPGAPAGTKDPEPVLEVEEKPEEKKESSDENDAKTKKDEKWDWASKGASGFIIWVKDRLDSVPKHSGFDSAGLERAVSYLDKLDNEISKAMRLDLDGDLDANKVEEVRCKIDEGISRLHDRLDKVKKTKKSKRKKADADLGMVKEAQRIVGVKGVYITVPLLISGIARICINGMVSAGHDLEETYKDQVAKYKLNDREKTEVRWLLFDMGYTMRGDRGFMPDEDQDQTSSDNYDYAANYGN